MAKKKKLKRKAQSHPTNSLATPSSPTPEEQRKILREAQNVNRGHPRKGETREELKQINVSCLASIGEQFTDLSLKTGRTKRALLEEAITLDSKVCLAAWWRKGLQLCKREGMAQSTTLSRPSRDLNHRCATLKRRLCWIIDIIYDEKNKKQE